MALYHSARGSVDYTIVGSPTITDGVASGFSENDSLQTNVMATETDITKYEFFTKFKVNSLGSGTYQFALAYRAGSREGIAVDSKGKLSWFISRQSGTTTDIIVNSSITVAINTEYTVWCHYLGNNVFALDVSTDNGTTWTRNTRTIDVTILSEMSTSQLITVGGAQLFYSKGIFDGSIDLNNTYIKVNGQPWFGVCPIEVKKHQLMGPVGYTVVGSPTITDGVASGFSSSNTLEIDTFNANSDEWEMVLCVNRLDGSKGNAFFALGNGQPMYLYLSASILRLHTSGSSDISIRGSWLNAYYYIRIRKKGNICYLDYSDDAITYINTVEKEVDFSNYTNNSIFLGQATYYYNNYFGGSIDLNETYIKVNGKLWFWQPRETEKIVVNGVQVWQKSS